MGFVYRAGFAAEKSFYDVYVNDLPDDSPPVATFQYKKDCDAWIGGDKEGYTIEKRKEVQPEVNALSNAKTIMNTLLDSFPGCEYVGYLSGKNNFRDKVATIKEYKGHRKNVPKPTHYAAIREYLIKHWDFFVVEGQEADDAVAIAQCRDFYGPTEEGKTVLVSQDKDLKMIPGLHYDWVKKETFFVEELEGMRHFYKQLLQGDGTDNIPGLYYITGSKCSKKYLDAVDKITTEPEMYDYVHRVYCTALGAKEEPEDALHSAITIVLEETGQLLWMRRKEGEIWSPPI